MNAKTMLSQMPQGNEYRVSASGRIVKKIHQRGGMFSGSGGRPTRVAVDGSAGSDLY